MNYNRLLFKDETIYAKWQMYDRTMYDEVNTDVNFNTVTESIMFIDREYPIYFLQYPVNDIDSAEFRKQIFSELYSKPFICEQLREYILMLNRLNKLRNFTFDSQNTVQKQYYHLQTLKHYIDCIEQLYKILSDMESQLLCELYERIKEIKFADSYISMKQSTDLLLDKFDDIQKMNISFDYSKGLMRFEKNPDSEFKFAQYVKDTFGIDVNFNFSIVNSNPITAMEETVLNYFCMEYPTSADSLNEFYTEYNDIDVYELIHLKPQIKFYISYIAFMKNLEIEGCRFTSPQYGNAFHAIDVYDLSLILTIDDKKKVVSNDINLAQGNIFVLSGPNQGGKTTFVRTIAITVLLALNGCHVPCNSCQMPYYDRLITHFNKNEVLGKGGRLQEELSRIREILKITTANSLLLFNECFASTRRTDGADLSLKLLDKLFTVGCNAGFITHYYEIADKDKRLISLTSGVESDGDKDDIRTYKIKPSPPEGNAYARTIAQRYGITFEQMEVSLNEHKGH